MNRLHGAKEHSDVDGFTDVGGVCRVLINCTLQNVPYFFFFQNIVAFVVPFDLMLILSFGS